MSCKLDGGGGKAFQNQDTKDWKNKAQGLAGQVAPAKNKSLDLTANRRPPLTNKKILLKTKCKKHFLKKARFIPTLSHPPSHDSLPGGWGVGGWAFSTPFAEFMAGHKLSLTCSFQNPQ